MSNNDNKWEQPETPPPPLFTGAKEKDLVKQVTDEIIERVIGVSVLYYPISLKHSNFHPLYGEAINKTYLPPVHVEVLAEWEGEDTATTGFGIDKKSSVTLHFHKRRLTEDQNLFVREGDFIQYGEQKYEIVTLGQPRQLFGQPDAKIEVVAKCVRARDGSFPSEAYAEPGEDEDPRLTAPACDPIEEIRVLTGDTTSTGGSGTQPCGEVYERPGTPPPPLFTGAKEGALVKQVGDEILERVVGQQIVYFPVSLPHSNFHELYGESINKTFLPPIRVFAAVDWKGSETSTTNFGIDRKSAIDVKFHKRRLTEDQNLFVREGDFVLYGTVLYEIVTVGQPRLLFGKIDEKYEVVATCIRAREGTFKLSEVPGKVGDFDLDSVTACDNANLVIPDGVDNTMANVGTGEGIFKNKTDIQFNMKTLVAGDNIVLTSDSDTITIDSAGEISGTITNALTASYVETAQTASWVSGSNVYGAVASALTASYVETAQTASYVLNAQTASYVQTAQTASYVLNAQTASYVQTAQTASWVSGSNVFGPVANALTASYVETAQTASYVLNAQTASYVETAQTASYVETAQTASYVAAANINGTVANAHTASYIETAQTASFYLETDTLDSVVSRGNSTTGSVSVGEMTASAISAGGHYIPTDDATYDIGSADKQVRDIYVSTGSIIFGGTHKIEVHRETNSFNFDSPGVEGMTIPCVDQLNGYNYLDGTILYDKQAGCFKFRQNGEWAVLGTVSDGGGNSGGGGSSGVPSELPGFGAGILALNDDGDGPGRNLLVEYSQNPLKYSGRQVYLANTASQPVAPFDRAGKFYFNEGGVWHPSPFFSTDAVMQPLTDTFPDMQDILSLNGAEVEDRTLLTSFYQNPESYIGRAIYLSSTGSSVIGDFDQEEKYYYNEGGTWFPSVHIAEEEDE
jgi:hypothetical protein